MQRARELKRWVTCVLVLVLLYQFVPAAVFSPLGKLLLGYLVIQTLFVMLGDARQEPHASLPDADPPAMARTGPAQRPVQ